MLIINTNFFEYHFKKDKKYVLVFDDSKLKSVKKVFDFKTIKNKKDLTRLEDKNLIGFEFLNKLMLEKNLPFDVLVFDILLYTDLNFFKKFNINDFRNPPDIILYSHTGMIEPLTDIKYEYKESMNKHKKIVYKYNTKLEDISTYKNHDKITILIVDDYDYVLGFKKEDVKIFFMKNLYKNHNFKEKTNLIVSTPEELIPLTDENIDSIYVMNKNLYKEYFKFLENYLTEGTIYLNISEEEYKNLPLLNPKVVEKNNKYKKILEEVSKTDLDLFPFIVLVSILEVVHKGDLIYYLESFNNFYLKYKTIFLEAELIEEFKIILDKIVKNYKKYSQYDLDIKEINILQLIKNSKKYLEKYYKVYHLKDKINYLYTDGQNIEKLNIEEDLDYPKELIKFDNGKNINFYLIIDNN